MIISNRKWLKNAFNSDTTLFSLIILSKVIVVVTQYQVSEDQRYSSMWFYYLKRIRYHFPFGLAIMIKSKCHMEAVMTRQISLYSILGQKKTHMISQIKLRKWLSIYITKTFTPILEVLKWISLNILFAEKG